MQELRVNWAFTGQQRQILRPLPAFTSYVKINDRSCLRQSFHTDIGVGPYNRILLHDGLDAYGMVAFK